MCHKHTSDFLNLLLLLRVLLGLSRRLSSSLSQPRPFPRRLLRGLLLLRALSFPRLVVASRRLGQLS